MRAKDATWVGTFDTAEEAARAHDQEARKLKGKDAQFQVQLNYPSSKKRKADAGSGRSAKAMRKPGGASASATAEARPAAAAKGRAARPGRKHGVKDWPRGPGQWVVGDQCDAANRDGIFFEATVVQMHLTRTCKFAFTGWVDGDEKKGDGSQKWDEWIDRTSGRLRTKTEKGAKLDGDRKCSLLKEQLAGLKRKRRREHEERKAAETTLRARVESLEAELAAKEAAEADATAAEEAARKREQDAYAREIRRQQEMLCGSSSVQTSPLDEFKHKAGF